MPPKVFKQNWKKATSDGLIEEYQHWVNSHPSHLRDVSLKTGAAQLDHEIHTCAKAILNAAWDFKHRKRKKYINDATLQMKCRASKAAWDRWSYSGHPCCGHCNLSWLLRISMRIDWGSHGTGDTNTQGQLLMCCTNLYCRLSQPWRDILNVRDSTEDTLEPEIALKILCSHFISDGQVANHQHHLLCCSWTFKCWIDFFNFIWHIKDRIWSMYVYRWWCVQNHLEITKLQ